MDVVQLLILLGFSWWCLLQSLKGLSCLDRDQKLEIMHGALRRSVEANGEDGGDEGKRGFRAGEGSRYGDTLCRKHSCVSVSVSDEP